MMDERRTPILTAEAAIEMWHASRLSVTKTYEMSPEIIKSLELSAISVPPSEKPKAKRPSTYRRLWLLHL